MKKRFLTNFLFSLSAHLLIFFMLIFYITSQTEKKFHFQNVVIPISVYENFPNNFQSKQKEKISAKNPIKNHQKSNYQKLKSTSQSFLDPAVKPRDDSRMIPEKKLQTTKINSNETFLSILHSLIAAHQIYPEDAVENHETGRVTIQFLVDKQGNLSNIQIGKSSGHQTLDAAAINAVQAISPVREAKDYLQEQHFFSVDVVFE